MIELVLTTSPDHSKAEKCLIACGPRSDLTRDISPLLNHLRARAFQSHWLPRCKRVSQRHVSGCNASRSRWHWWQRLARHTTADRTVARRRLDRRLDDSCVARASRTRDLTFNAIRIVEIRTPAFASGREAGGF